MTKLIYSVYVLKSLNDNFHYIGHSFNLGNRLKIHNAKKVRSTKAHAPYKIIYHEEYKSRSEAQKREYYLKSRNGNFWLRAHLKNSSKW